MNSNHRAGRPNTRIGIESLESRTLPSTTLPPTGHVVNNLAFHQTIPSPMFIHYGENGQDQHGASGNSSAPLAAPQSTGVANYSSQWGLSPAAVVTGTSHLTGSGRSTGSVAIALARGSNASAALGRAANRTTIGYITTSSSATAGSPDSYRTPITFSLALKDNDTGASTVVTFNALVTGTVSTRESSLNLVFQGGTTRQVRLGGHVYSVTLNSEMIHAPAPGSTPAAINASIQVH
jgi:hypothetical protein